MMEEQKQSDPSLPHRTSSRPRKTLLPQRRSTRPKKPPELFSSTFSRTEIEHGDREKTEEDNQSSAKIKLIRKKGKWIMNNDHEENKSKRFKSNRIGENKYESIGHAGAHSERNILNNNIEDEFVNILCEEVPFSMLVPPEDEINNILCEEVPFSMLVPPEDEINNILCEEVPFSMLVPPEDEINNILCEEVPFSTLVLPVPAEETGRVELPQPSPESFVTLDHDYAIPLTKGVRVKQHQNPQNPTKELELQDEDEVQIIREIPAKVLKINETEIKEEIEDLAETGIPSVTNKELSTNKSLNNNDNVAQNIVKEESEPENKDEVQTIGETDKNSTVQNVINTETIREFECSNDKVQSEGSLGEDETKYQRQSVDEVVNGTANAAIGHMVRDVAPRVEESSKEEENRRQGLDQVEADRRQGMDESVENRRQGVDDVREHRQQGVDDVREHRQQGVDQVRRHQHQGVDEVEEHRRQGVDEVTRHQHQVVDEVEDNRRQGVDEVEDNRRQGVDQVRRHQHQSVDEVEDNRRQGVDVVRDMRCCEACRRNDKIKIKMEIEMSTEQFVQVAKELPNIVTTAHVHS